jgi:hypothetical protein
MTLQDHQRSKTDIHDPLKRHNGNISQPALPRSPSCGQTGSPGRSLRQARFFVREDWVAQLDYGSLEKVDPGYIGRGLSGGARHDR